MLEGLEIRIAHLEGAYEQIDKRLGSIEARLDSLERRLDSLAQRMDSQFRWILGFQIATLLSLIGTLLTVFLKQ